MEGPCKDGEQQSYEGAKETEHAEDCRDDPKDLASFGDGPSAWIHSPQIDLPQITISHNPGGNSQGKTHYQSQYPQNQNQGATMRLHATVNTGSRSVVAAIGANNKELVVR